MTARFDDPADAPASDNLELLAKLRADLDAEDFTVEGVAQLLGDEASDALLRDQLAPARVITKRLDMFPLSTIVRVFLLAEEVAADALAAAFPRTGLDGLAELRLVARDGDRVAALVDLRPYASDDGAELWVASDIGGNQLAQAGRETTRKDHVIGIGEASITLAQLTVRGDFDAALDLGCGCGVHTFHLLRHSRRVVATDISERCLAFTRFNVVLNADALDVDPENVSDRVDLRLGSLLEPVAGETFDIVTSNPPFVITPRVEGESASDQFTYRDGGRAGDAIVEQLVRELPSILKPGGVAEMLGNWERHGGDAEWFSRIESWVPAGIDAWVLQREELTPTGYAEMWLRDAQANGELQGAGELETGYAHYIDDFAARAVTAVSLGWILVRRPLETASMREFEKLPQQVQQPVGGAIADAFAASERLAGLSDEQLGALRLAVAPDVTEEQHSRPGDDGPRAILLRQGGSFRRVHSMTTELAGFVSVCDGDLTVAAIVAALAELLDVDEAALAASVLPDARRLIRDGFLRIA